MEQIPVLHRLPFQSPLHQMAALHLCHPHRYFLEPGWLPPPATWFFDVSRRSDDFFILRRPTPLYYMGQDSELWLPEG